jgi:hypothetical protein
MGATGDSTRDFLLFEGKRASFVAAAAPLTFGGGSPSPERLAQFIALRQQSRQTLPARGEE